MIPSKTHLASLISPLIIRIATIITCFSLKIYTSTYINFLYTFSKNLESEREG
jgi:hypothetical protein